MASEAVNDLIEAIATWPTGMPVRAMERLIALGASAVAALNEALDSWQDDDARDILWLIVLLGELRHADSIAPLIRQLCRTDLDYLAVASAEALAKIGKPALPALIDLTDSPDPEVRLYAYITLGWIDDERSFNKLTDLLTQDSELADIIANALADQGRADALPLIYQAYKDVLPWQRAELEDAMIHLHAHRQFLQPWQQDWRLRYRRDGVWDSFNPGWPAIASTLHRNRDKFALRDEIPLRSLEEILAGQTEPEAHPDICENCGAITEYPTGVPVCPETALLAAIHQVSFLQECREAGYEDLFDILDDLEDRLTEANEEPEAKWSGKRKKQIEQRDELAMEHDTCRWLIEQGKEYVGPAKAFLLAQAGWLAGRDGDPHGLLQPAKPLAHTSAKIGRNDPCPCGSGQKYKRCCLGKDH